MWEETHVRKVKKMNDSCRILLKFSTCYGLVCVILKVNAIVLKPNDNV